MVYLVCIVHCYFVFFPVIKKLPTDLSHRYTKHACKLMAVNHKRLESVTVDPQSTSNPQTISVHTGQEIRTVSLEAPSCECSFFQQHHLPCCHMVKCYTAGFLSLESIVFGRWTKDNCNFPTLEVTDSIPLTVRNQPAPTFRRVEAVLSRASDLIMACGNRQARERLSLLEGIIQKWENNEDVQIVHYEGADTSNTQEGDDLACSTDQSLSHDEHEAAGTDHNMPDGDDVACSTDHNMPRDEHEAAGTDHNMPDGDDLACSTEHNMPRDEHEAAGTDHNMPDGDDLACSTCLLYTSPSPRD